MSVGAGILVFLIDLLFRKLGWFKKEISPYLTTFKGDFYGK